MARGDKRWTNTWTEIEDLGNGKFGASISVGHRVFFDKADGSKPKKHKLTDNRPDHILVQGAKCCVEVHPYYAKYFDVQHEEVRLHEERWVVQRLSKKPDKWQDVDAYNPCMAVEEYPEPAGDVVKVTVTYDTDYGILTVEYFQRDGNNLKHNVTFQNISGSTQTFRVLQRWAGIVGEKCNGKDFPLEADKPFLAFRGADGKLAVAENLRSIEDYLYLPIKIEAHTQGTKADFIYGNWVLADSKTLEIDPATATLDDSTEDGHTINKSGVYTRDAAAAYIGIGYYDGTPFIWRGYVEWDISAIPSAATITDTVFKYHCYVKNVDCHIHEMVGTRPSTTADDGAGNLAIYNEAGEGTVYADPAGFPVNGTNQSVDLGASADSDLKAQLASGWFAIGLQSDDEGDSNRCQLRSEEYASTPDPTLYVVYTVPTPVADGDLIGIAIIRKS